VFLSIAKKISFSSLLKTQSTIKPSNNKCSGGWWLEAVIPKILSRFNDGHDEGARDRGI
jgi:hypothetical protein